MATKKRTTGERCLTTTRRRNDYSVNLVDHYWFDSWVAGGQDHERSGYGTLGDLLLGMVGAIVGGWIMRLLGFLGGGLIYSIVVATLGAVLLIWLSRKLKK